MKATDPGSYPELTRHDEHELVFARPVTHKLWAGLGVALFATFVGWVLLKPADFEGPRWLMIVVLALLLAVASFFLHEAARLEQLVMDLERRAWRLRRGVWPLTRTRRGSFDDLSHVGLEQEPWDSQDSAPFTLFSVWLHFSDSAIDPYCLGVRPRGLKDLGADHEKEVIELAKNYASKLALSVRDSRSEEVEE